MRLQTTLLVLIFLLYQLEYLDQFVMFQFHLELIKN
uniref:Uncharacterized protein n=1 Tax=CrAss-like virus sp. ctYsL76 TaxID=2826826 RepID=A0A8S5QM58_9CAUD|nr:MAG TPA: hypothetical protein [CrAss-like virus sp. ctYsL76]